MRTTRTFLICFWFLASNLHNDMKFCFYLVVTIPHTAVYNERCRNKSLTVFIYKTSKSVILKIIQENMLVFLKILKNAGTYYNFYK